MWPAPTKQHEAEIARLREEIEELRDRLRLETVKNAKLEIELDLIKRATGKSLKPV
jgi:hypothetical protein